MYQEKSKKQPIYDIVYLKPLEGFTVEEVTEEKKKYRYEIRKPSDRSNYKNIY